MSTTPQARYPLWTRGDLDGFFGLMVDNLVQVLLIISLCTAVAHLPDSYIYRRILPGVAISLLIGNLFYGLQAHYSARKYGNPTCTALPYGINTPSVIAYVLFIMGPVYQQYAPQLGDGAAADLAWKAGLLACLVSGIIEMTGSLYAEKLRRVTPRAGLLGVLAGIGITFIAAEFAFRIYTSPLVGILPMAFLLLAYFAYYRFPWRLPGGFLSVVFGTAIAWVLSLIAAGADAETAQSLRAWLGGVFMSSGDLKSATDGVGWIAPTFWGHELWAMLTDGEQRDLLLRFLTVSIPMGVMNVIGSLQNIESAEAGGDRFRTGPSLAVNGVGSFCAGLFGSCFPTTIYIGHPGWKALGARSSYSILNGLFFTILFLFGLGPFLRHLIPIEAGAAIVLYIGIIITAQAFQATPRAHAPAVAIALFPALAAFVIVTVGNYLGELGGGAKTLADFVLHPTPQTLYLPGLVTLYGANSTWIVVTLILAAIGAELVDRRYGRAAVWAGAATVLTALGLLHAYRLEGNTIHELFIWQAAPAASVPASVPATPPDAPAAAPAPATYAFRAFPIAVGYALMTVLFAAAALRARRSDAADHPHETTAAKFAPAGPPGASRP
ncbi:MAG: NCS2 family permease [Planctomycetota bacterium]